MNNNPLEKTFTGHNIVRAKYIPEEKVLEIEFQNRAVYHYKDFPRSEWDESLKYESFGSFFYAKVRGKYSYVLVKTGASFNG